MKYITITIDVLYAHNSRDILATKLIILKMSIKKKLFETNVFTTARFYT